MKKNSSSILSGANKNAIVRVLLPVAAVLILMAIAVYLYGPHWFGLGGIKILWPINSVIAGMGCFVLTRRWISSFDASLVAAALYGFGPFGLSFASYHPLAGLSYAAVPWLLCPAVYYHSLNMTGTLKSLSITLLALLPFAAIVGLFWSAAHHWAGPFFLMPQSKILEPADLLGILTPMLFVSNPFAIGFYHVPLICILMGLCVFALSGKEILLAPVMAGIILSLLSPVCNVPPVVWLSFAALFLSVCASLGIQSLAWAGNADRFWILACAMAAIGLAGYNFFLNSSHPQETGYRHAFIFFLASAAAAGFVFVLTKLNLRLTFVRWLILFGLCAYDFWLTAPILVDSLF